MLENEDRTLKINEGQAADCSTEAFILTLLC